MKSLAHYCITVDRSEEIRSLRLCRREATFVDYKVDRYR